MYHRCPPVSFVWCYVIAFALTNCQPKPEVAPVEGVPTDPALIRKISYELYDNVSKQQWDAYIADFSRLSKPSNQYNTVYKHNDLGQIIADSTTYQAAPALVRTSRYSYNKDQILRTYVPYGANAVADTTSLNQQGRVNGIRLYWGYNLYKSFRYTYDRNDHVITERHYDVTDCTGTFFSLDVKHTVENQNRTATQHNYAMGWLPKAEDIKAYWASTQINYQYDLSRPNPGLPYDDIKLYDVCSGVLNTFAFHPGMNSGLSKNLLKRVIARSKGVYELVTQHDYYYEYDVKKRLKTVYIAESGNSTAQYAIHKRSFQYVDR